MTEDFNNERSQAREQAQDNEAPKQSPEQFESDAERIVHRHLENKDDIITDEDIASVRVGMTPEFDEATEERFEEDALEEAENADSNDNEDIADNEDPITPLDTIKS